RSPSHRFRSTPSRRTSPRLTVPCPTWASNRARSRPMSERHRPRVAVAVAAFAAVLAGCANIPTRGAVHVGRPLSAVGGLGDVDVRVQPPQAQPGLSSTDVVRGFLRAVVNSDGNYEIARSYLTSRAAQGWDATGITTYDDGSVQFSTTTDATKSRSVKLQVARRGFIDAR